MEIKDKEKKRLRLFDLQRDGKGISKSEPLTPGGMKRFFRTVKDNFGKLVSVNMIMVLGNFPLLFLIITLSGYTKADAYVPLSDLFQNIGGMLLLEEASPATMSLYGLVGMQNPILVNTPLTYVFYGISALTVFTFGIVNTGTAYALRNMAMGEPVFVWTDFWYAVKRNLKQAMIFGAIDVIINFILIFNMYTMIANTSDFFASMLFWGNIIVFILYFFMRPYIYVQIVTFRLSLFKIVKNSLIFTLLGLKRNLAALLGTLLCLFIEVFFLAGTRGVLIPLAIAAPLAILFALCAYMKVFAAYFRIKDVIIDPYNLEHPDHAPKDADYAPVMRDDVTERERLAEIKAAHGIID